MFLHLKSIVLFIGTPVSTIDIHSVETPDNRAFYDDMFVRIPLSVERVVLKIGHLQSQKSKFVQQAVKKFIIDRN